MRGITISAVSVNSRGIWANGSPLAHTIPYDAIMYRKLRTLVFFRNLCVYDNQAELKRSPCFPKDGTFCPFSYLFRKQIFVSEGFSCPGKQLQNPYMELPIQLHIQQSA